MARGISARVWLTGIAGLILILAVPASSPGATVTVDGSPLNISTDEVGQVQAVFDSDCGCGQFDGDGAGLFIGMGDPTLVDLTPGSGPTSGGTGTAADPFTLTTQYLATGNNGDLNILQVDSYVNGENGFSSTYTITRDPLSLQDPVPYRAILFADLYPGGEDVGHGTLEPGAPRFLGAVSDTYETAGGLVEVADSPWDAFQAGDRASVFSNIAPLGSPGFPNTVDPSLTDSAIGVQWDDSAVTGVGTGNPSDTYRVRWEFHRVPAPVHGQKIVVRPVSGTVLVKAPGHANFRQLFDGRRIPVGSEIDARGGFVEVTSERGNGTKDIATFWQGMFQALQKPAPTAPLNARLSERLSCKSKGRKAIAATWGLRRAAASAGASRRLWAKGTGRFRTTGYRGSATIRGTEWLTQDRCRGKKRSTRFRVRSGVLAIDDFTKKKNVNKVLRRGGYTAK